MFGPRLRRERERRGISLDAIARSTKVSRSLFEGLERDDVSRWPCGIFRRSFLREYATAIGVAPEPLLDEFLRLFPEPGSERPYTGGRDTAPLRLTLVQEFRLKRVVSRVLAAALDVAVVLTIAQIIVRLLGAEPWTATAAVALSYCAVGTIVFGRSLASWSFSRVAAARHRPAAEPAAPAGAAPQRERIAPAPPRPQPAEASVAPAPADAPLVRSA